MTEKKNINELSFEDALLELEGIVKSLELGSVKLDEALSTYERGVELRNCCQQKLADAKLRIEKVALDGKGEPSGVAEFESE